MGGGLTNEGEGIHLEQASDSDWHIEKAGAGKVARLKPSSDYYTRAAYHLTFASPQPGNCG